jgi:hypothetical protein
VLVIDARHRSTRALAFGQDTTNRIQTAIVDIVVSNASSFADYHKRRDELTRIDPEYLFFYCVSLALYARSSFENWKATEIDAVLESAATEFVRSVRYHIGIDQDDERQIRQTSATLRSMFANVSQNFRTLMTSADPEGATFTLFMMYLDKVYPACNTIFLEGHMAITGQIMQAFGQLSMSAFDETV